MENRTKKVLWSIIIISFSFGLFMSAVSIFSHEKYKNSKNISIKKQFNLDGSHKLLKRETKKILINKESFIHIKTKYEIDNDFVIVSMKYSCKDRNNFTAISSSLGVFDLNGNVIKLKFTDNINILKKNIEVCND